MLFAALLSSGQATLGVDLSTLTSQYPCFKSSGHTFAIIRGYCSYGGVDPNINANIKNSNAAGLITDIYMFPCRGKSAADQVNQLVAAVGQPDVPEHLRQSNDREVEGMKAGRGQVPGEHIYFSGGEEVNLTEYRNQDGAYGMVWIDVETNPSSGCSWSGHSGAENCAYLGQLISALEAKGKKVGIYASAYMWEQIMGSRSACTSYTRIPIWYAHYDGSASFSDWSTVSFGGWSKPSIKQYSGDKVLCSTGVDLNFY